jgi:site-specific recombinase XerD
MRIGAYCAIKTADVAHLEKGKWVAKRQGRTLEKGNKMFTFLIHERVQELLTMWLNKLRGFDASPFLFVGKFEGKITTSYFRTKFHNMCRAANLQGPQYHPHALRHCYAHILLHAGNSAETISKMINHESTATTQKYYLRETAAELAARANIPWMQKEDVVQKPLVPSFLFEKDAEKPKHKTDAEKTKMLTSLLQSFAAS